MVVLVAGSARDRKYASFWQNSSHDGRWRYGSWHHLTRLLICWTVLDGNELEMRRMVEMVIPSSGRWSCSLRVSVAGRTCGSAPRAAAAPRRTTRSSSGYRSGSSCGGTASSRVRVQVRWFCSLRKIRCASTNSSPAPRPASHSIHFKGLFHAPPSRRDPADRRSGAALSIAPASHVPLCGLAAVSAVGHAGFVRPGLGGHEIRRCRRAFPPRGIRVWGWFFENRGILFVLYFRYEPS